MERIKIKKIFGINVKDIDANKNYKCIQCGKMKSIVENIICSDCNFMNQKKEFLKQRSKRLLEKIPEVYKDSYKLYNDKLRSSFIYGETGTGKTTRGFAMIQNNIKMIPDFTYIKVDSLLMRLNPMMTSNIVENFEKFCNVYLLFLDDISVQNFSEASIRYLFNVIDTRLELKKLTIITSMLSLKELTKNLPIELLSRIQQMCKRIKMTGKNRRVEK